MKKMFGASDPAFCVICTKDPRGGHVCLVLVGHAWPCVWKRPHGCEEDGGVLFCHPQQAFGFVSSDVCEDRGGERKAAVCMSLLFSSAPSPMRSRDT